MSHIARSIRRALEQAIAFAKGEADQRKFRVHPPNKFAGYRARADFKAFDRIMKRRGDVPPLEGDELPG